MTEHEDYLAVPPDVHARLQQLVKEHLFWSQQLYSREGLEHLFPGIRRSVPKGDKDGH